ncbi:hypothetical protein [Paenibacillus piri]|uniref:Uncharacterized protein n=1 Tax=Paenibacillus piri TaxID=2547395 RepID=A0A4R5KI45_9BACL|nr:hypothetical protein [Paenibacillus piri]TDF94077.1 hypothetical protein E1757_24585 [Paenibacillus piri]
MSRRLNMTGGNYPKINASTTPSNSPSNGILTVTDRRAFIYGKTMVFQVKRTEETLIRGKWCK